MAPSPQGLHVRTYFTYLSMWSRSTFSYALFAAFSRSPSPTWLSTRRYSNALEPPTNWHGMAAMQRYLVFHIHPNKCACVFVLFLNSTQLPAMQCSTYKVNCDSITLCAPQSTCMYLLSTYQVQFLFFESSMRQSTGSKQTSHNYNQPFSAAAHNNTNIDPIKATRRCWLVM